MINEKTEALFENSPTYLAGNNQLLFSNSSAIQLTFERRLSDSRTPSDRLIIFFIPVRINSSLILCIL